MDTTFHYSKNISGKLALGYGSKYQLLRMLGWHQNFFNEEISKCAEISDQIKWLDFNFSGPEDKELMNAVFLGKDIATEWNTFWPARSQYGINWDAVGTEKDTIILVEAKAHTSECGDPEKDGGGTQKELAGKRIEEFQEKYHLEKTNWLNGDVYQLANRLVFADFLRSKGKKVKLVYVLFLNGFEFNTPSFKKSVHSIEEWQNKFDTLFKKMKIKNTEVEKMIHFCYIDCNPSK